MTLGVGILGAAGRMGGALIRGLREQRIPGLRLAAAVDRPDVSDPSLDLVPAEVGIAASDVLIDFSFHAAAAFHADLCAEAGKPLVLGTTGLTEDDQRRVVAAARQVAVVQAPNMSLGVNLLMVLAEQAARALQDRGYDVEIVERHHRKKKDSPSGTALGLGEAVARGYGWDLRETAVHGREGVAPGERPEREIGFHAVRGGDFVGDHTVIFAAEGECVELGHRATTRDTFATGALRAAAWVATKPAGLYSARDVLGL